MNLKLHTKSRTIYAFLMALFSILGMGQTPFVMSNGNYSENFDDIANWANNFASGIGAAPWKTVATNSSGVLGDGVRVTTSSTFSSGTSGGVQKGTGNLVFLSTGTTNSVAADLYLNFSSRNAGTISFDAATIFNGSGNRDSILKVFYSINNGSTFIELTGTNLPYTGRNNVVNNSTITATLPVTFNNLTNAIIRFYEYSTTGGGASISGSQPKISIDNLTITSTAGNTPTIYTTTPTALDSFSEIFGSTPTDVRSFTTNAENLTANLAITPPANWEISLSPNSGFTTGAISLTPSSNNVAQTNIYVRLANGSPIGAYSGNITLSSTGATTKNVSVSGNVNLGNPIATAATTVGNTSFNANWNAVSGATGYFIDVYKLVPATVSEGFDAGSTAPTGWTFTGLGSYTSGGISAPSLRLDDTGDRILTPLYNNTVTELKFWILGNGTNTTSPSSLLVEGFNGTSWVTIENITPIATTATTYTYNSTSSVVLPSNLKQFRFTYTKNLGNIAFDDFSIITDQKSFATGFENKTLGNVQTILVDNLTPATQYFYVVRASNGTVTSNDSNVITVNTASATTWNGSGWSNGIPSSSLDAIVNSNYSGSGFTAQSLTINANTTLTVGSGETVRAGNVTNNGNIIVNDGGNFIQNTGAAYTSGTGASFITNRNSTSAIDKYLFWSSPIANQNIFAAYSNGSAATAPVYVMSYDTATNLYPTVSNDNANFTNNAGKGYSVKVPATNASLVFGGVSQVPNNGTVNVSLAGTAGGTNYNLIGNPYPSNLNLADFYAANNTAIEQTLWFWDNSTGNVTTQTGNTSVNVGFATFNAQSGTWTEAPNTQAYGSAALNSLGSFAKIGQGFIVKSINAGAATFTNAMRSSSPAVTLNKNGNTNDGKFWIKLNTSYGNSVTQAITYSQGALNSYDVYDSKAMATGSDAFFSLADAEKVIIQGRASFHIDDMVPLGTKHFETGNFTISLSHKEGLFSNGQPIYLHDKQNGTYTNLQLGNYTFAANAGEFTNRFEIVYKLNVLATNEVEKASFEVYKDGDSFVVRNNKNIQTVEVFDAVGRKVQQINANSKSVTFKVSIKGVYIIKAVSEGKEYTQKIIK